LLHLPLLLDGVVERAPLEILCATAPLIPAASSSDREAPTPLAQYEKRSSVSAFRRPALEPAARASQ